MRPRRSRDPSWGTAFGRRFGASILTALTYEGLLEEVNDRGIVASLSSEAEMLAASTFYPWAAILSLRLTEEQ